MRAKTGDSTSALSWLPEELRATARTRLLKAGETLFSSGDRSLGCFVVLKGRVKVFSHSSNGAVVLHYFAQANELFGEAALFSDTYECDARAEEETRVAIISRVAGRTAIRRNGEFAESLLNIMALRVHYFRSLLEIRRIRSAKQRLLEYSRLAASVNSALVAPKNGRELAELLGLDPASHYRALAQLRPNDERAGLELPSPRRRANRRQLA